MDRDIILLKSVHELSEFIEKNIRELLECNQSEEIRGKIERLPLEMLTYLNENHFTKELEGACRYIQNDFSPIKEQENIANTRKRVLRCLNTIKQYIELNKIKMIDYNAEIDEYYSLLILKKIMNNFPLHIKTMYQEKCHGKGGISDHHVSAIQIVNEYDVQRILYSIIKPIFPNADTEVIDNTGCSTIRYDIDIESCNTTIEVKCSRSNMCERTLNEEMGSDSFHYKRKNIIFFVYDKECIVSNIDAYKRQYNKKFDGKEIDIIIIQPIKL